MRSNIVTSLLVAGSVLAGTVMSSSVGARQASSYWLVGCFDKNNPWTLTAPDFDSAHELAETCNGSSMMREIFRER